MKRQTFAKLVLLTLTIASVASVANAQSMTFTGTVVRYGSGRYTGVRTANFTLTLKRLTADDDAQRYLSALKTGGQDALMNEIKNEDLGTFQLDSGIGRTILAVRERNEGGKRKILAVFDRWEQFAELRGGYRSLDYPFGYVELTIDPATGKGSGQYFAAAKIRWKKEKDDADSNVEIEDYATVPARLLNVKAEVAKP